MAKAARKSPGRPKKAGRPAKKAASKKSATKKSASKKSASKKSATKKSASKSKSGSTGKNKLGVKNSLVNNINARKKKGASRPKKKSTVSKDSYDKMEDNWGRKK